MGNHKTHLECGCEIGITPGPPEPVVWIVRCKDCADHAKRIAKCMDAINSSCACDMGDRTAEPISECEYHRAMREDRDKFKALLLRGPLRPTKEMHMPDDWVRGEGPTSWEEVQEVLGR